MKEMKECKEMVRTARTDENKCQQINVFFIWKDVLHFFPSAGVYGNLRLPPINGKTNGRIVI